MVQLIIPVTARTLVGAEKLLRLIEARSTDAEALSIPLKMWVATAASPASLAQLCL